LNGLNANNIFETANDEEFKNKWKLLKRKVVAHLLIEVSKTDQNKQHPFISIGFKASDVKPSNLEQDYYWQRFILGAARGITAESGNFFKKSAIAVGNFFAKNNFLASAFESLVGEMKKQFAADKWKLDVWDADQSGQILMSDNADATVHINSGGEQPQLEQEKDANYGNEKRLRKLLLGIKEL
jgi:hypothetical protein